MLSISANDISGLVAAMFRSDVNGRLLGDSPFLHVVRTKTHVVCQTHADLAEDINRRLIEICQAPLSRPTNWAQRYADYVNIVAEVARIVAIRSGPLYIVPVFPDSQAAATMIHQGNTRLLERHLSEWIPDVSDDVPMAAVLVENSAVATCASVCTSPRAHCAGVETAPAYRGKGFARAAVLAWAAAVAEHDATPFYAATFDNLASQNLARSAAMSLVASEFSIYARRYVAIS